MKATIQIPKTFNFKYIKVDAFVRFTEDCEISLSDSDSLSNDSSITPAMPFMKKITGTKNDGFRWQPMIDIDEGKLVDWPEGVYAKTYYKVCDEFECSLIDENDEELIHYDGYVPNFMAIDDHGYGDYIIISIDRDGHIKNWKFNENDINVLL